MMPLQVRILTFRQPIRHDVPTFFLPNTTIRNPITTIQNPNNRLCLLLAGMNAIPLPWHITNYSVVKFNLAQGDKNNIRH